MRTRVRLLAVIVTLVTILSSCTMVQIRQFNEASPVGTPVVPETLASDYEVPVSERVEATAATGSFLGLTAAQSATVERIEQQWREQFVAAQTEADNRRARRAAVDREAAEAQKQAEIATVLAYIAAEQARLAAEADPFGYNRVAHVLTDTELKRLRDCESTDRYHITNPSGKYRGAYQFDFPTWDGVAARWFPHLVGVDPINASPEAQDAMTRALWSERGRQPWPECGLRV